MSSGQETMEGSDYLSLKKKVSPLICATASKTTGSLQMSIGVTGPWVGGRGLPVGTPVFKEFTNVFRHTQSKSIYLFPTLTENILIPLLQKWHII